MLEVPAHLDLLKPRVTKARAPQERAHPLGSASAKMPGSCGFGGGAPVCSISARPGTEAQAAASWGSARHLDRAEDSQKPEQE
jgi:hypothetical protein